MGFGMTTVLLNIHNAGFFPMDTMILAMGIFYGGLAQIFAGIMEFKKGNTFGTTAFTSYGCFWLTLVFMILRGGADRVFMGWYLFMWVFSHSYSGSELSRPTALQTVFFTLTLLFWLLAIGHWFEMPKVFNQLTGFEGIITDFCHLPRRRRGDHESKARMVLPIGVR